MKKKTSKPELTEAKAKVNVEAGVSLMLMEFEGFIEPYYLRKLQEGEIWSKGFSKGTRSKKQEICQILPETIFKHFDNVYATKEYRKIKITIEFEKDNKQSS